MKGVACRMAQLRVAYGLTNRLWRVATLLVGASLALYLWVAPRPLGACSYVERFSVLDAEVTDVADGVVVVQVSVDGAWAESLEVRDASDSEIPGELDREPVYLRLAWDGGRFPSPAISLYIWRADEPLDAGATYRAEFIVGPSGGWVEGETEFTFTTRTSPYSARAEAHLVRLEATRQLRTTESCEGVDGDCGPCTTSHTADTEVRATLPPPGGDRYLVSRLLLEDEPMPQRRISKAAWDFEEVSDAPSIRIRERAAEYCVILEVQNLLDGSIARSQPTCVADSGEPEPTPPGPPSGGVEPTDPPDVTPDESGPDASRVAVSTGSGCIVVKLRQGGSSRTTWLLGVLVALMLVAPRGSRGGPSVQCGQRRERASETSP